MLADTRGCVACESTMHARTGAGTALNMTLDTHFFDGRGQNGVGENPQSELRPAPTASGVCMERHAGAIAPEMKATTRAASGGSFHLEKRAATEEAAVEVKRL